MRRRDLGPSRLRSLLSLACSHDQGVTLVGGGLHAHLASAGGVHRVVPGAFAVKGDALDSGACGEGVTDGELPTSRCGDLSGVLFAAA